VAASAAYQPSYQRHREINISWRLDGEASAAAWQLKHQWHAIIGVWRMAYGVAWQQRRSVMAQPALSMAMASKWRLHINIESVSGEESVAK
jgi:hypothetical protein